MNPIQFKSHRVHSFFFFTFAVAPLTYLYAPRQFTPVGEPGNPWLPGEGAGAFDEILRQSIQAPSASDSTRCVICKGTKRLCGKDSCPVLMKFYSYSRARPLIDGTDLHGNSPPGVFIGRIGYPHVYIGPLIPPHEGDTSHYDTPETWVGRGIGEIMDFRSSLVRGKYRVEITDVEKNDRIVELTREMALAREPAPADAQFTKRPAGRIALGDDIQPFGPSAPLQKLDVGNIKFDNRIERAFYDKDLKAADATLSLYRDGTLVSKIQKAFSVGAFGLRKNRKFVPTRWSITAVDSIIGLDILSRVKTCPWINEYRVYETYELDNRWIVLMIPERWCYELIEAWYPNTAWNPFGLSIAIYSSHEFFEGRKTYAEIGGCYYAARMASGELLQSEGRQAGVCIMRETHPGYVMPVGVWNVRENVRNALRKQPRKFATLKEALFFASTRLDIPIKRWITNSAVLRDAMYQRKIDDWARAE